MAQPMTTERHTFDAGEFSVPTADLCFTNEVKCFARGGDEFCSGMELFEGRLIFCICVCHQKPATA